MSVGPLRPFHVACLVLACLRFALGGSSSECGAVLQSSSNDAAPDVSNDDMESDELVSADSHNRRLGEGPTWWCTHDEYTFMECFIVTMLIIIAMVFEKLEHSLRHLALKADDHGHETDMQKAQCSLKAKLVDRAAGELTVLGFIAFLIWLFRISGGFDFVGNSLPDHDGSGWRFPRTGNDLLHMVEDVHMFLFIACLIFYFIVFHAAAAADKAFDIMHEIEKDCDSSRWAVKHKASKDLGDDHAHVARWYTSLRRQTINMLIGQGTGKFDILKEDPGLLNFATYLEYNLRLCLGDLIEFNPTTWCTILIMTLGILVPIIRLGYNANQWIGLALAIGIFAILGYMYQRVQHSMKQVATCSASDNAGCTQMNSVACTEPTSPASPNTEAPDDTDTSLEVRSDRVDSGDSLGGSGKRRSVVRTASKTSSRESFRVLRRSVTETLSEFASEVEKVDQKFNTELYVLRSLQALIMMFCYGIAATVASKWYWVNKFWIPALFTPLSIIWYLVLRQALANLMPKFLVVMAAAPNIDPDNMQVAEDLVKDVQKKKEDLLREVSRQNNEAVIELQARLAKKQEAYERRLAQKQQAYEQESLRVKELEQKLAESLEKSRAFPHLLSGVKDTLERLRGFESVLEQEVPQSFEHILGSSQERPDMSQVGPGASALIVDSKDWGDSDDDILV